MNNKIILADQGGSLMLQKGSRSGETETRSTKVYAVETTQIPPTSEMEIVATVKGQVGDGSWLLEGVKTSRSSGESFSGAEKWACPCPPRKSKKGSNRSVQEHEAGDPRAARRVAVSRNSCGYCRTRRSVSRKTGASVGSS